MCRARHFSKNDIYKKYFDAGVATRVHFNSHPPSSFTRFGYSSNDCLFRAKNHARWLLTNVDVDEYVAFSGGGDFPKVWEEILQSYHLHPDNVRSIALKRIRFARAASNKLEISSTRRVPAMEPPDGIPKLIVNVDHAYKVSFHDVEIWDQGAHIVKLSPEVAIMHHYRMPRGLGEGVEYENAGFVDENATFEDTSLVPDVPMLEAAIQQRFELKGQEDLKHFLQGLAQRISSREWREDDLKLR
eukprot:s3204_g5.t1